MVHEQDGQPRFLTTKQAAEYLGGLFAEASLVTMRSRGGGPKFRRVGGRIFYTTAELDEWMMRGGPYESVSDYRGENDVGEARAAGAAG